MRKKLLSLLMMMVLFVTSLMPAKANAEAKTTEVVLHKLVAEENKINEFSKNNSNYDVVNGITNYGEGVKEVAGVYFLAVKKADLGKVVADPSSLPSAMDSKSDLSVAVQPDIDKVDAYLKSNPTFGGLTTNNGLKLTLPDGEYVIFEIKEKSDYKNKDNNVTKLLAKSKAVPAFLKLPYISGAGVAKKINLYPKNTEDGPGIDKFVDTDKKVAGYNVGDEVEWTIKVTVPSDFKDYKTFNVTDNLKESLDYVDGSMNVEFKGYAKAEINVTKNDRNLKVDLMPLKQEIIDNKATEITLTFKTKLNDKALMGNKIENSADINFGHKPNEEGNKNTTPNPPGIYTGGRKFKKTGENGDALQGAKFYVKNKDGKYLQNDGNWAETTDNAKKLISDDKGMFEIKGLAYGTPSKEADAKLDATKYYLEEFEAPEGYAKLVDTIEFSIDGTSYTQDILNVENKKQVIPQTGGIGTVVFTVVGLLLMATSFIALRSKKEQSR